MENDSEISTAHNNWLKHPLTQAAFRAIEEHKYRFIEAIERDSSDVKNVSNKKIRTYAVGLKTCSAIKELLSDSNNFHFNLTQTNLL